jgi:transcription antitermination factor NusG
VAGSKRKNTNMSKKNASAAVAQPVVSTPVAESTIQAVAAAAHLEAANDIDLASYSDEQLHELLKGVLAESKRRKAEALANLPQAGATVEILDGKFKSLQGTILKVNKSRCYVAVPNSPIPAYVLLNQVKLVVNA